MSDLLEKLEKATVEELQREASKLSDRQTLVRVLLREKLKLRRRRSQEQDRPAGRELAATA